ncbi:MAG: uroporphyrinogen decarboxylase family protein [candidate division KSB1 bacterium]|nr:uroporphyrinogen decarboxylase family protein [candidate division KSB1 bacterium]MDQ7063716.1 uroporphyrinogen decarboxylase family protein [candidate division KSB1 bacterium]
MTSGERVQAVLRGEQPDRVPLNVFAGWNPGVRAKVNEKYGSVDAFCEAFHLDIVTGVLTRFPFGGPEAHAQIADLDRYLELDPIDPTSPDILGIPCDGHLNLFLSVREALDYHRQDKPVFVHVWGVFELTQFLFEKNGRPGVEEALINMTAEPEKTKRMFFKLAEWSAACAETALQAGADVIELSDDWGQQNTTLFSPQMWWDIVFPATKLIVEVAHKHDVPVLLHSDGDITTLLAGVKQLGIRGLHPVQESAGMSYEKTREILGRDICIMGGLDTITALPVMNEIEIRQEVERVFSLLKPTGPFIFAGSHMFQDDAPLEVIEAVYRRAYELAAY